MTARSSGTRLAALVVSFGLAASCFLPSEPSDHVTFEFRFTSPLKVPLGTSVPPNVVVKAGDQILSGALLTLTSLSAVVRVDGTGRQLVGMSRGAGAVRVTYRGATGTADTTFDVRAVVSSVRISPAGFTIRRIGDSVQLMAHADAPDSTSPGIVVAPDEFSWLSDNSAVATVSGRGVVRAFDEGNVRISAKLDDVTGVALLEVLQPAAIVQIRAMADTLRWLRNTTRFLLAAALDSNGAILDGAKVRWTSLDPAVATIEANTGVATAIRAGTARIVGRVGLAADTAPLVVKQVPLALFVRPGLDTLTAINDTGRVVVLGSDSGGSAIPDLVADSWTSENPAIASINPSGLVTAHANGIVLVTAKSGTETAFGTIVVRQMVSRVDIQPAAVTLTTAGATAQLTAIAVDKNGYPVPNPGALAWRSHLGLVATVDSTGVVTARGNGRTAVSATIGAHSGAAAVTVTGAPQELIAFESGTGIEAMRADGSLRTVLIPNVFGCSGYYYYYDCTYTDPAWSPDGTKLAYVYNSYDSGFCYYGCQDIYTAWPDGSDAKSVTGGIGSANSSPAWSPDGTRIAFSSDRQGGSPTIHVMNADGSSVRRVVTGQAGFNPQWSPDGTRIVFDNGGDIFVVNADGTGVVKLTNSSQTAFQPAWSPDGRQIAFASQNDIWLMNPDGTGLTNLTGNLSFPGAPTETRESAPSWSPDGSRIVFASTLCTPGCEGQRLFIVNRDGSGLQALNVDGSNPAWHAAGSLSPSPAIGPSRTARIQR